MDKDNNMLSDYGHTINQLAFICVMIVFDWPSLYTTIVDLLNTGTSSPSLRENSHSLNN